MRTSILKRSASERPPSARKRAVHCLILPLGAGALLASGLAFGHPCEVADSRGDSSDIVCVLHASDAARLYRFRADFSGSHDDTRVWIEATLDGAPVRCEEGSRTLSEAEDGEVTLACRFRLDGPAGTKRILGVRIAWRHAEPAGFALDQE